MDSEQLRDAECILDLKTGKGVSLAEAEDEQWLVQSGEHVEFRDNSRVFVEKSGEGVLFGLKKEKGEWLVCPWSADEPCLLDDLELVQPTKLQNGNTIKCGSFFYRYRSKEPKKKKKSPGSPNENLPKMPPPKPKRTFEYQRPKEEAEDSASKLKTEMSLPLHSLEEESSLSSEWCVLSEDDQLFAQLKTPEQVSSLSASYTSRQLLLYCDSELGAVEVDTIFKMFQEIASQDDSAFRDFITEYRQEEKAMGGESHAIFAPLIKLMVQLLQYSLDPVESNVMWLRILAILCRIPQNSEIFIQCHAAATVMGTMAAHCAVEMVQLHCCRILAMLAQYRPLPNQKAPVRESGVDLLTRAMHNFKEKPAVVKMAAQAVANVAASQTSLVQGLMKNKKTRHLTQSEIDKHVAVLEHIAQYSIPVVKHMMEYHHKDIGIVTEGKRLLNFFVAASESEEDQSQASENTPDIKVDNTSPLPVSPPSRGILKKFPSMDQMNKKVSFADDTFGGSITTTDGESFFDELHYHGDISGSDSFSSSGKHDGNLLSTLSQSQPNIPTDTHSKADISCDVSTKSASGDTYGPDDTTGQSSHCNQGYTAADYDDVIITGDKVTVQSSSDNKGDTPTVCDDTQTTGDTVNVKNAITGQESAADIYDNAVTLPGNSVSQDSTSSNGTPQKASESERPDFQHLSSNDYVYDDVASLLFGTGDIVSLDLDSGTGQDTPKAQTQDIPSASCKKVPNDSSHLDKSDPSQEIKSDNANISTQKISSLTAEENIDNENKSLLTKDSFDTDRVAKTVESTEVIDECTISNNTSATCKDSRSPENLSDGCLTANVDVKEGKLTTEIDGSQDANVGNDNKLANPVSDFVGEEVKLDCKSTEDETIVENASVAELHTNRLDIAQAGSADSGQATKVGDAGEVVSQNVTDTISDLCSVLPENIKEKNIVDQSVKMSDSENLSLNSTQLQTLSKNTGRMEELSDLRQPQGNSWLSENTEPEQRETVSPRPKPRLKDQPKTEQQYPAQPPSILRISDQQESGNKDSELPEQSPSEFDLQTAKQAKSPRPLDRKQASNAVSPRIKSTNLETKLRRREGVKKSLQKHGGSPRLSLPQVNHTSEVASGTAVIGNETSVDQDKKKGNVGNSKAPIVSSAKSGAETLEANHKEHADHRRKNENTDKDKHRESVSKGNFTLILANKELHTNSAIVNTAKENKETKESISGGVKMSEETKYAPEKEQYGVMSVSAVSPGGKVVQYAKFKEFQMHQWVRRFSSEKNIHIHETELENQVKHSKSAEEIRDLEDQDSKSRKMWGSVHLPDVDTLLSTSSMTESIELPRSDVTPPEAPSWVQKLVPDFDTSDLGECVSEDDNMTSSRRMWGSIHEPHVDTLLAKKDATTPIEDTHHVSDLIPQEEKPSETENQQPENTQPLKPIEKNKADLTVKNSRIKRSKPVIGKKPVVEKVDRTFQIIPLVNVTMKVTEQKPLYELEESTEDTLSNDHEKMCQILALRTLILNHIFTLWKEKKPISSLSLLDKPLTEVLSEVKGSPYLLDCITRGKDPRYLEGKILKDVDPAIVVNIIEAATSKTSRVKPAMKLLEKLETLLEPVQLSPHLETACLCLQHLLNGPVTEALKTNGTVAQNLHKRLNVLLFSKDVAEKCKMIIRDVVCSLRQYQLA
ncbi:uncharacterized protein LOC106175102 [Lingula anatina]|uniref:Uncharacterized protein LOC106175102 n=1 Tax=Lingula anatina TaxID=7574 RepID=A0A1S3JPV1_LINAN|nr:uncharacterized protein LOC106175102 [Lingula anatina]|eukprot:XP_013412382.1 uncharacterized protein LOC106175102 [Lingula anatina]